MANSKKPEEGLRDLHLELTDIQDPLRSLDDRNPAQDAASELPAFRCEGCFRCFRCEGCHRCEGCRRSSHGA